MMRRKAVAVAVTPCFVGFESTGAPTPERASDDRALAAEVDRVLSRLSEVGGDASSLLSVSVSLLGGEDAQRRADIHDQLGRLLPDTARPVLSFVPAKQLLGSPVRLQAIGVPQEVARDRSSSRFPDVAAAGDYVAATNSLGRSGSIVAQSETALTRLRRGMEELGGSFGDVADIVLYFVDRGTREEWAEAALMRAASFAEPGPCATGISVDALADAGALIQFHMLGVIGARASGRIRDAWPDKPWEWPFRLPYRHGNRVGSVCFVGGQSSRGDDMTIATPTDLAEQVTMTIEKVVGVLEELGGARQDIARLTAHYVAEDEGAGEVVRDRILAAMPQQAFDVTLIGVHKLAHPDMLVEINAEAVVEGERPPSAG